MDLTNCDPAKARVVELPYEFGTIVYHKTASERCKGIVTAYSVTPLGLRVCVCWGNSRSEEYHCVIELTTEYVKDFSSE